MKKTVKIKLFKDTGDYKEPVFVCVNGESYMIKRGEEVEVPAHIAAVLENSAKQDASTASLIEKTEEAYEENTKKKAGK